MSTLKKQILFYISHFNYGGAENALLSLIPFLASSYEIIILTDIHNSSLSSKLKPLETYGVEIIHLSYPFSNNQPFSFFRTMSRFCRLCIKRKIDYFIPLFLSNSYGLIVFKLFLKKTKILIWEHTLITKHYPRNYPLYFLFFLADSIILPSLICANDLISLYPSLSCKIKIVPNPCTLDFSLLTHPSNMAIVTNNKSLINLAVIGRLSEEKQIHKSLYCLKCLLDLNIPSELVIYGSGSLDIELKNLATSLSISNYVKFSQFSINFWENVRPNSIILVTSKYESFSMVSLEALCLGHYVVMTPEANSKVFENHHNLLLCKSSSISDITDALIKAHNLNADGNTCDIKLWNDFSPQTVSKTLFDAISF